MADELTAPLTRPKNRGGRPPGSKNKPKQPIAEALQSPAIAPDDANTVLAAMTADLEPDPIPPRPDLRPAMTEPDPRGSLRHEIKAESPQEDSLASAARRAAEIRVQRAHGIDETNKLATPPAPPGWTYGWKMESVYQQEDTHYAAQIVQSGWTAVPVGRHPHMMPFTGHAEVIRNGGLKLMEIPTSIYNQMVQAELNKAVGQIRTKEAQLVATPPGQAERIRSKSGRYYEQPREGEIPRSEYQRDEPQ